MSDHPRIDDPVLPDGYVPTPTGRHLEWETVTAWLSGSLHYWLSTSRPDGRPHVVPRWGVWLDGAFWYDGSPEARHVRNLEHNPHCALHLESGERVVILEGISVAADPVTGSLGERLAREYARKYAPVYTPTPDSWSGEHAGGMRLIRPAKIIAWSAFPDDVTRFTFEDLGSRPR